MYGFFLSTGTKKVAVVERWPLAEVRLHYLASIAINYLKIQEPFLQDKKMYVLWEAAFYSSVLKKLW